jgi:single-strand DNA-binding protein
MNSFNQCTFIGHAGSIPKLLATGNGKSFTRFRLGVSNYHKNEEGTEEETLWLTVLVWREEMAKVVSNLVVTGSLILVSGRLSQRAYTDKDGQERINLELIADKVELLGKAKQSEASQVAAEPQPAVAV